MWGKRYRAAAGVCLLAGLMAFSGAAVPSSPAASSAPSFAFNEKELLSNRFTRPEPEAGEQPSMSLEGFEPALEDNRLAVYLRRETGAIRVIDKNSGYVWGSIPEDKPDNLNKAWSKIAGSMVAADLYDKDGVSRSVGAGGEELTVRISGRVLTGEVYWEEQQVGLTFRMELAGGGLRFSMEDNSIREDGDWKLGTVYFVPFLGSTVGDERQGYIFVPDGSGALIRFHKPRKYLQGFDKRVYGLDVGIDSLESITGLNANRTGVYMTEEETVSLPVFGMVHGTGQNAFMAQIDSGADYARILADPAGIITDYNRAYVKFVYRQTYEQPVSKTGTGVQTLQETRNRVSPCITYRFLTGDDADYVGMAKAYRSHLAEQGILKKRTVTDGVIPLQLDVLAAEVQKEFIGTSLNKATGLDALTELVSSLQEQGIGGIHMTLVGWQKGGLNGYRKTSDGTGTVYGSLRTLSPLRDRLDGRLYLRLAPFTASEKQLELRSEAGISLSQSIIVKKAEDSTAFLGDLYYLKPRTGVEALLSQTGKLADGGFTGWSLDDIGYQLYSDYLKGNPDTRTVIRELIEETMATLSQNGQVQVIRPAAYLFPYADSYLSAPMTGSGTLFETDSVPFLQIVLSGYMDLFAPYTNQSFYSRADILKQIDYGTYPSYLLTEKDNYALRKTASSDLRSTRIADWQDHIRATAEEMNAVLAPVRGQSISDRVVLETGLTKTVYETGAIYVNYHAETRTADGHSIPGGSALYVKGEGQP